MLGTCLPKIIKATAHTLEAGKMRILHIADIHARDKNIEEIETCLWFVVQQAKDVDLIVIAGDIFDSRDIRLDSKAAKLIIKTISELADIAPVAVIVGTPSHDGTAPEILRYSRGKHFIHVSSMPEQIYLVGGELSLSLGIGNIKPDAILTMIPQPTKQYFNQGSISESNESISQAMNGLFAGFGAKAAEFTRIPHVLVGHWNVSGARLSTGQILTGQEIDISIDQMGFTNAAAHLLGHIHMSQQIGDRTFYSGSLYPLTWAEVEDKGFWLHEFDADELCKSTFVKTPTRKLTRFAYDLTDDFNGYSVADRMASEDQSKTSSASVRLDLTVWQDDAAKIDKETITKIYMENGALDVDIRIIRIPRETVRSESVLKADSLRLKLLAMAELRGESVTESILIKSDLLEFGEEKVQVAA
jgi:DNA repair exonuclease SbcCD nuclease subunit